VDERFVAELVDAIPGAFARTGEPLRIVAGAHEVIVVADGERTSLAIELPGLDRFGLLVSRGDKWFDIDVGDDRFDDAYAVVSNDDAMAVVWLDRAVRDAVLQASYWRSGILVGWWSAAIADDRIVLAAEGPADAASSAKALRAAIAIADRGARWRDAFRAVAGDAPMEEGVPFAFGRLARVGGARPIEIAAGRSLFGAIEPALAVIATSPIANGGDVVLARRDLPEPWWDELLRATITDAPEERADLGGHPLPRGHAAVVGATGNPDRLAALAADPAFAACPPTAVRLREDAIDLLWTGAELLDERLIVDTARALIARVDVAGPSVGPYR
jgi:hypothetical protein